MGDLKKIVKGFVGTTIDVVLGGTAIKQLGASNIPFKEATSSLVGVGVLARAAGRTGILETKKKKNGFL